MLRVVCEIKEKPQNNKTMGNIIFFIYLLSFSVTLGKKYSDEEKPGWAKKDIRDFTDADMER